MRRFQLSRNSPMFSSSLNDVPFLEFRIYSRQTGDYHSVNNIETASRTTGDPDPSYDQYFEGRLLSKLTILDNLYILW